MKCEKTLCEQQAVVRVWLPESPDRVKVYCGVHAIGWPCRQTLDLPESA